MTQVDYYQLLGISRGASRETIKRAFRSCVRHVHPDCNPQNALATEHTRRLVEAYRVLSDPAGRQQYDLSAAPCARAAAVYRYMSAPCYSQSFQRTLTTLVAICITVSSALWLAQAIVAEPAPAHRFVLNTVDYSAERDSVPTMIQPDPLQCVEYYRTQEYELSGAGELAAYEVMRAYDHAARRAPARAHRTSAHFYESSLTDVQNSHAPFPRVRPALDPPRSGIDGVGRDLQWPPQKT